MGNDKLETISNLFEGSEIRSIWDSEKEDYYFSVVDVVGALTSSEEPRKYWSVLKNRLKKEGSELTTKCSQLKMLAPDGKMRLRDALDTLNYQYINDNKLTKRNQISEKSSKKLKGNNYT